MCASKAEEIERKDKLVAQLRQRPDKLEKEIEGLRRELNSKSNQNAALLEELESRIRETVDTEKKCRELKELK